MADEMIVKELDQVVVRFSGDSGDGMQLAGNIFSNISATVGNDISTFPDYPADIRAPQGSLTGVSGFQVHIGAGKVFTPGDKCDVLVAMNAAALKTQYKFARWLSPSFAIWCNKRIKELLQYGMTAMQPTLEQMMEITNGQIPMLHLREAMCLVRYYHL